MTPFSGWENFYVIVGSSAGALIGLQFVVITLIADLPLKDGAEQAGAAFGTPTIVHFGTVLLISALFTAPWRSVTPAAVVWGMLGFIGLLYAAVVARRMRVQKIYRPEMEDWIFHAVTPIVAYATLLASAILHRGLVREMLFVVAAAVLLLLFTGIHNAWDAVTYHVYFQRHKRPSGEVPSSKEAGA